MADRILETADRLFYGQGIRAMGVDTIAAEIGIAIYPNNSRAVAVTSSARHHSVSVKSQ